MNKRLQYKIDTAIDFIQRGEKLALSLNEHGFLKSWLRLRLGRQGLRLPPSAFLSLTLGFGSGYACLGYAVLLDSLGGSPPTATKKKAVFSRKKSVQGNAHFSRKWNVGFLFRLRFTKT